MTGLPPPFPPVPALRAGAGAVEATRSARLGATLTSDVLADVVGRGVPAGAGRAHDAAEVSLRGFARHTDLALAALETLVRGLEVFEHEVAALMVRREDLVTEAIILDADVRGTALVPPDPALTAELWVRRERLLGDVSRLLDAETSTEDALLRVLWSADTEEEAADLADVPGRASGPALAGTLRGLLGRASAVRRWWEGLAGAERQALVVTDPDLVVNADGLPASVRDDAGRAALARDLPTASGRQRELLEALRTALALGGGSGLLLLYDRRGDGRGAVAYGDPDTSDNTVVLVPGLGTDLGSIDDLGRRALDLREAALQQGPPGSTSVVVWIGYDAPDFVLESPSDLVDTAGVLDDRSARAGAVDLVRFVDGLRGSDSGEPSRLTVVGHSYGSTTTALAASSGLDADAVVLLASPGAGDAHDAGDLGGTDGDAEVFVGSRDRDPVTWLGGDGPAGLGRDPAQEGFGGTRFEVGDGRSFHAEQLGSIGFLDNHTTYFTPGSQALDNLAAIAEGRDPEAVPGRDEPARDLLTKWLIEDARHHLEAFGDRFRWWS